MKTSVKIILGLIFLFIGVYVCLPQPGFPEHPENILRSNEPADLETPLRQAYYTDLTREEVISYYNSKFNQLNFMNITLPHLNLNYPPEEAQTIIRDQTHSTFLEEIAHPLRESLFINGYEPKGTNEVLTLEGKEWRQKIIVKYVPSPLWIRIAVVLASFGLTLTVKLLWLDNLGLAGKKKHD